MPGDALEFGHERLVRGGKCPEVITRTSSARAEVARTNA
jgi:hypothetical protein